MLRKPLLFFLFASTSLVGCAADTPTTDEQVSSEADSITACGTTPRAPVCNAPKCTTDGWVFVPEPFGYTCPYTGGGFSICDGGDQNGVGHCATPGAVDPQYKVMSVVYAPPGHTGDATKASTVTYGTTDSSSTDTKVTNSFKQSYSVSASEKLGILGVGLPLTVGGSYSYAKTHTTSDDQVLAQSSAKVIVGAGSARDGLDHDNDQILVWLNPRIATATSGTRIWWDMEINPNTYAGSTMNVYPFRVGDLKNPAQMLPSDQQLLTEAGVTTDHYGDIVAYDPLAYGAAPDPKRFILMMNDYWYQVGKPVQTDTLTSTSTTTHVTTDVVDNTLGATVSLGIGSGSTPNPTFSASGSWDWTTTNDDTNIAGSVYSASFTVQPPAAPTPINELHVYWDTVYKTFAFALIPVPQITGTVYVRGATVTLVDSGITYTATSDMLHGHYQFDMIPTGAATISALGQTKNITVTHINQEVDFTPVAN